MSWPAILLLLRSDMLCVIAHVCVTHGSGTEISHCGDKKPVPKADMLRFASRSHGRRCSRK